MSPELAGWQQEADRLAQQALADDAPTAWFERLYQGASDGSVTMPWEHDDARPLLAGWLARHAPAPGRAVVVGCGLGAEAEHLAALGHRTTGFDVSPTAMDLARARHPGTSVDYRAADLFDLPAGWRQAFDLVVEMFTVQALPLSVRPAATAAVAGLVAPGGTLVVISFQRASSVTDPDGPPWPLSREDIDAFTDHGLSIVDLETVQEPDDAPFWRVHLTRP